MLTTKIAGLIAAGAIALGALAATTTSNAQYAKRPVGTIGPVKPGVAFLKCAHGFRYKGRESYTCFKTFRRICKPGTVPSRVTLHRVRGIYVIRYRCMKAPH